MIKRRKREWFADDSFWAELYPFMFPEQRFRDTPEQIQKVLALAKPVGNTALDLCCGPGRCAIALAKTAFEVTGVDRTKFLLDKARAKARAAKTSIEWIQADMRDFIRADAFDLALIMFTSFGYFDDKNEDLQVLHNVLTSLKPGGICVVDVIGKEILAKVFQPTLSDVLPDGTKLIQRHEVFDDWTRIRNEWILIRKGKAKSFKFHHTIYSGQELKDRLLQVGFIDVKLYGSFDGDDYGPNAHRLIAVAYKAGQRKTEKPRAKASRQRD
jgi:SAM-dependent methyltransferase